MNIKEALTHLRGHVMCDDPEVREETMEAFDVIEQYISAFVSYVEHDADAAGCDYALEALRQAGFEDDDIRNIGLGYMLDEAEETIYVSHTCPMCGRINRIKVNANAFAAWKSRTMLLQDAFPDLNRFEREFVKSGYCPEHQSLVFGVKMVPNQIELVTEAEDKK